VVPNYVKPGRFAPDVVIGEKVLPAKPLVVAPEIRTFVPLRRVEAVSGAPISGAPISGVPRKMGKGKKKMPPPPAPVSGVGPYEAYEKLG
jgi:hypothetical protein